MITRSPKFLRFFRRLLPVCAVVAILSLVGIVWVLVPTVTPVPQNICGETEVVPAGEFERPYFPYNSGLKSKNIRTLTMGQNGLWIGYAGGAGVGFYDGTYWRFCQETPHVNAIVLDAQGYPWVGTDAPPGGPTLLHYDGTFWTDYTQNLPDYRVYDLTYHDRKLYVATWEGVAEFDGETWTVPYNTEKNIFQNNIHAIAFVLYGDMWDVWFGSIDKGVTWHHPGSISPWMPVTSPEYHGAGALLELSGDNIRAITVAPSGKQVWIASDGGDVTMYDYVTASWTRYPIPNNHVTDLKFDHFGRAWIATTTGVFYYENNVWNPMPYEYPALTIAFGCEGCVFGPDVVFIGTNGFGLIQADVPPQFTR